MNLLENRKINTHITVWTATQGKITSYVYIVLEFLNQLWKMVEPYQF